MGLTQVHYRPGGPSDGEEQGNVCDVGYPDSVPLAGTIPR